MTTITLSAGAIFALGMLAGMVALIVLLIFIGVTKR